MNRKLFTVVAIAIASLVAGCASSPANTSALVGQVDTKAAEAQRLLSARAAPVSATIRHYSESWIPLRKVEKTERELANAKTDAVQIEINQTFANLNELSSVLTSLTGLPVFVSSDTQPLAGASLGTGPMMPGAQPGQRGQIPTGSINANSSFAANYSGSLTGFLNLAATYYGVSWKNEEAGLRLFLMESKSFQIAALPGDTRLSSAVESVSNAATGGTGGTQNGASANSTGFGYAGLSVWASMEASVKQMLSTGGKALALPAVGTMTVTDTPSVLARVSAYIAEQNKSLNRQVAVNVRVLSVELNDVDDYGINWDAVYTNLSAAGNPFSLALKTAFPVATGAGNMIISAPLVSTKGGASALLSSFISALSTQGRVSELTSATMVTLNNQPAPVNVGRRVSYLASSSTTVTTNAAPTVTLNPGTVQTGFSMTLVPHIIDNKELLLQYSIDLSSLLAMKTISSGGSTIETPDVATSNFIQRVRMQAGETLVVAGFDHDNLSSVADGMGSAQNSLAGRRNGTKSRTMLVVLIQPNLSM